MLRLLASAFAGGLLLGSCAPVSLPNATAVISSGDTVPMFTTRITMCTPVIHEMPNWIETDPDDSIAKPLRYASTAEIVKVAR